MSQRMTGRLAPAWKTFWMPQQSGTGLEDL